MNALKLVFGTACLISSAPAEDFFPLQPGNVWAYRNATTGESFTVSVGSPVVIQERVYHLLRGYAKQPLLVRLDERKDLVQVDEKTGLEQTLTSFVSLPGGWWEAPARGCAHEGMALNRGTAHDGAAGPFPDVRELFYRTIACADFGIEYEQYAGNIGMLRRIATSIAGPQTFDLAYARVGNIRIDTAPHAAFSVAVLQTLPFGLIAQLRLQTDSGREVKLIFPTGQEFDVALRDAGGKVLWKYSDGKVFAAALHETIAAGQWGVPVQIPGPVLEELERQPGTYTVQAWLTTIGSAPEYAATVPLTIPGDFVP